MAAEDETQAGAEAPSITMARTAKGKRPKYFSDPAIDKLLNIVFAMAAELSVARDRIDTLERLLDEAGVLDRGRVNAYRPDPAADAERQAARMEMIERLLRILRKDLEETTGRDMPETQDDIWRAVS